MAGPNVLWIVSDHQAHANRDVDPAMFPLQQRLRQLGTEFPRAYTVLPICTPARASMLTGCYPHTHGLTENDGRFGGRPELEPQDHLLHRDFQSAGYRCGWFGKWHLNHESSACDHGFEGFSLAGYGYPYATETYRSYLSKIQPGPLWAEVEVSGESRRPPGTKIDMTAATDWFDYEAGCAVLHGPEDVHEAHFLANLATEWIDAVAEGQPFFLRLDPWGPHPPYTIPSGFVSPLNGDGIPLSHNLPHDLSTRPPHHREYRDQWRKDLRADAFNWACLTRRAVEHCILVERAMTKVLDHLEASGRLDDTIIVFCADHGDAVASNGGVMNKGSLMVEETLRIPMFIAGPELPAARVSDGLFGNVDIAPTLLDLCGLIGADNRQGLSAAQQLRHSDCPPHRERLMVEHYGLHVPILQRGLFWQNWKYVIQPDGFEELYDLAADPYEMTNLAGDEALCSTLLQMRCHLKEEMLTLQDSDPRLATINRVLSQEA